MSLIHKVLYYLPLGKNALHFNGQLHVKKRNLKPGFLSDLCDFMQKTSVKSALIIISSNNSLKIYGVPKQRHQRLRNIYKVYH